MGCGLTSTRLRDSALHFTTVLDLGPQAHRGLLAGQSRNLFPSIRSLMGILPGSAQAQTGQERTADLLPHGLRGRPGGRRHESSDQQLQEGRHPYHALHQDHAWRSRGLLIEKLPQEQRSQCAHLAASRRIWCGHAHGQDPQVLRQARALDLQRPSQALRLMTRISENIREHSTTVGPAGPLFNAGSVYTKQHNLHHLLDLPGFIITVTIGALAAVTITYVIAVRWSSQITYFVMRRIPHEAVLALFVAFVILLAYIDADQKAGLANVFGVLLVGIACGSKRFAGEIGGVRGDITNMLASGGGINRNDVT